MQIETIERNNKKVLKKTKKDGTITYSMKGAYLGTDKKTGKQVTTTITAPTLKALDRKYLEAKRKFEENDSTRKNTISIGTIQNCLKFGITVINHGFLQIIHEIK